MKLGVTLKIDVSKIDKTRLYKGAKGVYLDATVFIDTDNPSQYGDHGMISQQVTKEERENKQYGATLGNATVFYGLPQGQQQNNQQPAQNNQTSDFDDSFDDDIPF